MTTVDTLIATARERTGLNDFGGDSFHEGLVALVRGAEAGGKMNDLGVAVLEGQAVDFLSMRLSIEDCYRRHPEIDEQEIPAPLFGLGLPRTGSTALSFMLAEDPRTRSLRTWEANSPAPPPEPETYDTDPRIADAIERIAVVDQIAPLFKDMLPSSPTGPTECLQLLALDFRSAIFASIGDNRGYEHWLLECDMRSAYEYHKRVLKLLQWKFEPRPWRLKTPAHMQSIEALVQVYPEARFVMTHRDIAQVIPSVVNLLDVMTEYLRSEPLPSDFAADQAMFWETGLRRTLAYRDSGHEGQFFDIAFTDMRTDPMGEMAQLYDWLGEELTEEVDIRMRNWWATNSAEKHGSPTERPDYGIDPQALRAQFAFYNERFLTS